jgi:hypothetical protein
MYRIIKQRVWSLAIVLAVLAATMSLSSAQSIEPPISQEEFVRMLNQLPKSPSLKEKLIEDVRQRGLGFELTEGLRSLVATKSGSDALLRRTLDEAARRRANPTTAVLPPEPEGLELLAKAKAETVSATGAMPDFIVKQLVRRSYAVGGGSNWQTIDRLTLSVSYRESKGEEYKLLTINGQPPVQGVDPGDYSPEVLKGGASSSGEYVSMLSDLFRDESHAKFTMADTDTVRNRRTIVFEYEVELSNSRLSISAGRYSNIIAGHRGRIWVDREDARLLRMEQVATNIPADFPIRAASRVIDFEWVTIAEKKYLLPSRSEIQLTDIRSRQTSQFRNEILFRGYQKFGAELKVADEIDEADFEGTPPPPLPKKPPMK